MPPASKQPPAPTLAQRVQNSAILTTLLELSPARLQQLDEDANLVVRETEVRSRESELPLTGEITLVIKYTVNPEGEQVDFTVGSKVKVPDRGAHVGRLALEHNGKLAALNRRDAKPDNVVSLAPQH